MACVRVCPGLGLRGGGIDFWRVDHQNDRALLLLATANYVDCIL
jgi:hypothetical protein